jgi:hypothetical protein
MKVANCISEGRLLIIVTGQLYVENNIFKSDSLSVRRMFNVHKVDVQVIVGRLIVEVSL